jgi:hypothetical protein
MWAFEGTGNAIRFKEHKNGSFSIHGKLAKQDYYPTSGANRGERELIKVDYLDFSIYTPESEEQHIDGAGWGLLKAFRAKPMQSHGMISYYPKDKDQSDSYSMIGVTVLLCERSIERLFDMYKRLFGRADLHHRIVLDFFGFLPEPHPESELLTVAQFTEPNIMRRKPHLTDSVDFSFYSHASEPAPIHETVKAQAQQVRDEMRDALAAVKQEIAKFGQWIGIAVTIIAFIVVLTYLRH